MLEEAATQSRKTIHKFKVLCEKLNKASARGKSIFSFPFLCQAALDSNGCGTLRFFVSNAVYFSFQNGRVMCNESCASPLASA